MSAARSVLFVSKGAAASSTRYRALDYFPLLAAAGWEPSHLEDTRSLRSRLRILQAAGRANRVVVLRRCFAAPFRNLLRRAAGRLIFDFDDAIFSKSSGQADPRKERRFRRMITACDQVWAGNPYLGDFAAAWSPNVLVLPTAVDTDRYRLDTPRCEEYIDLVWIGSSSTRKHLLSAVPALELAGREIPGIRLKIVADFSLRLEHLPVLAAAWSPQTEAAALASAHIGIAPLPDNRFTRGKCGLKVLQYMAAALPVITSPTGVNQTLVEHGRTGLHAGSAGEWIDAVGTLAGDPRLRTRMGLAGRDKCVREFSLPVTFARLLAALNGDADRTPGAPPARRAQAPPVS